METWRNTPGQQRLWGSARTVQGAVWEAKSPAGRLGDRATPQQQEVHFRLLSFGFPRGYGKTAHSMTKQGLKSSDPEAARKIRKQRDQDLSTPLLGKARQEQGLGTPGRPPTPASRGSKGQGPASGGGRA